jgi:hypothetical protein
VLANSKIDQQVFLFVLTLNALIQLGVGFAPLLIAKKWLTKVEWTSFRWKGGRATLLGLVVMGIGIPFIYYFSAKVESLLPSWMLENAMEDDSNAFYQQLGALSKVHPFVVLLSTVIIAPLTEELMFRGVLLQAFRSLRASLSFHRSRFGHLPRPTGAGQSHFGIGNALPGELVSQPPRQRRRPIPTAADARAHRPRSTALGAQSGHEQPTTQNRAVCAFACRNPVSH